MEVEVKDASGQSLHFLNINGYLVPAFYLKKEDIKQIVTTLPNFVCRKNDIMLCTYPKTGTNWVFEIVMMMLRGSSERIPFNKIQTMLEIQTSEMIDDQPPPRVLNTHLSPRFLPKDLVSKQIKTILVIRNPKDTAVSYYNHMTGLKIYKYAGEWENWLPLYMHGKLEYGKYSTYLQEWERIIEGGSKFPLHVVYYEDLHQNCLQEVKRLAEFLNISVPDRLITDIVKMCQFDKMADEKFHPTVKKLIFKDHFKFFRKGKVGDWKNWFTDEQSKEYDTLWAKEMRDSRFQFVYEIVDRKSKL